MNKNIIFYLICISIFWGCSNSTSSNYHKYIPESFTITVMDLNTFEIIDTVQTGRYMQSIDFRDNDSKLVINYDKLDYSNYFEIYDFESREFSKYDTSGLMLDNDTLLVIRDYPNCYSFNTKTRKKQKIGRTGIDISYVLDISKNSSRIYYSHLDSLYSIKTDSSEKRFHCVIEGQYYLREGKLIYEDKKEKYLICRSNDGFEITYHIYDFELETCRKLVKTLLPRYYDWSDYRLSVSERNKEIIFEGYYGNNFEIFRYPLAGGRKINVTKSEEHEYNGQYAMDGKLLYLSENNINYSRNFNLYISNLDGSERKRISKYAYDEFAVSSDGTKIAFIENTYLKDDKEN